MVHVAKKSGLVIALCAAFACASGGPTYSELASTLPPLAAGSGRIFLYMMNTTEVPSFRPLLTLDDSQIGEIHADVFRFVDRPAGLHQLGVYAKPNLAAFGTQGATAPLEIPLEPGELYYVRVDVYNEAGMVAPALTRETPENATRDMQNLVQGEP